MVFDWHNFGFSIMALSTENSALARVTARVVARLTGWEVRGLPGARKEAESNDAMPLSVAFWYYYFGGDWIRFKIYIYSPPLPLPISIP